jgi:hypothetical protein
VNTALFPKFFRKMVSLILFLALTLINKKVLLRESTTI